MDEEERHRRRLESWRRYNKKRPVCHVRVSPEELAIIEAAAARRGITVGAWIVEAIDEELERRRKAKEGHEQAENVSGIGSDGAD